MILGSMCGLRSISQIHQWASNERVKNFLWERFNIMRIPSYFWLLSLLKLIKPESLNQCFIKWAQSLRPNENKNATLSFDGKTIRSTGKMDKYESPLHIVSAQLAELGLSIGQKTVDGKSNEIPAMRELIGLLNIKMAAAIIDGKGDYLLNVKDNQETLKKDIEDYVQDTDLQKSMDSATSHAGRVD